MVAQSEKKAVILDTDIGDTIDDAWALALLLRTPDVDLKLVLVGLGSEQELVNRARVARHLLDTAGAHHVPVGLGIRRATGLEKCPNVGSYWMPDQPPVANFLEDGVGAMLEIVKCHASVHSAVTVICIGPATNIAAAVREGGASFAERVNLIGQFGKLQPCSELEVATCADSGLAVGGDRVTVTFDDEDDVNSAYDTASIKEVLCAPFHDITCCSLELVGSASENVSKSGYQSLCKVQEPLVRAVLALDSKYDACMRSLGARNQETWYSDLRPTKDSPSMFWDAAVIFTAIRPCSTLSFQWQPVSGQASQRKAVKIASGWPAKAEGEFSSFLVQHLGTCEPREHIPSVTHASRDEQHGDHGGDESSLSASSTSGVGSETAGTESELKEDKFMLALLYFNVFLDLLGFGLILPLMPYLGTKFHADSVGLGLLTSIFAITKFIGSIAFGMAADRIGKKTTICICLLGCVISYVAMGFAESFTVLVVTRGMAGFFSNTVVVAQSIVPMAVPAGKRPKHQGYIGAAIGAGIAFGPGIGGGMSQVFGVQSPMFFTAGLGVLNLALVLYFMPKFGASPASGPTEAAEASNPTGKGRKCQSALQITMVLMSTLSFWLGYASFEAEGGLFFADTQNMGAGGFGIVCSVTGVVQLVLLAWAVKPLVRCVGEIGTGVLAFAFLTLGWLLFMIELPWIPYVAAVFVGVGFVVQAAQANLLSSLSSPAFVGTLLGVNQAMASLGRFLGPLMAGVIYSYLEQGIWIASASFAMLGMVSFLLLYAVRQGTVGVPRPEAGPPEAKDLECGC